MSFRELVPSAFAISEILTKRRPNDGKSLACINAHTYLSGRMIGVLASLREDIDDQLRNSNSLADANGLAIVGLHNKGVKTLIVKIDEHCLGSIKDAGDCAIVQIEKSESAPMAHFALIVRYVEQRCHVEDVCIKMHAVDAVGHISGQLPKVCITYIFLDLYILGRQFGHSGIDSLGRPFLVPCPGRH